MADKEGGLAAFARRVREALQAEKAAPQRTPNVAATPKESMSGLGGSQPAPADVMSGDRTRANPQAQRPAASSLSPVGGYVKPHRPDPAEVERRTQEHLQRGQARSNPYVQDVRFRADKPRSGHTNPVREVLPIDEWEHDIAAYKVAHPEVQRRADMFMKAVERLQAKDDALATDTPTGAGEGMDERALMLRDAGRTLKSGTIDRLAPMVEKRLVEPAKAAGGAIADATLSQDKKLEELKWKIENLKSQQAQLTGEGEYVDELDEGHVSHDTKVRGKFVPPKAGKAPR